MTKKTDLIDIERDPAPPRAAGSSRKEAAPAPDAWAGRLRPEGAPDGAAGPAAAAPKKIARKKKAGGQGVRNKELGRRGEEAAANFLARNGFTILERNWTCFAGEADIIATDGRVLIFVEVKTRRGICKGFPSEAVNANKRERYERIALAYVQDNFYGEITVRFDVVSIVVMDSGQAMVRHHLNAFCSE